MNRLSHLAKNLFPFLALVALVNLSLLTTGCVDPPEGTGNGTEMDPSKSTHDHDDHHDHSSHSHAAPHGGHLIELGRDHEYHAELVDNHKTATATIYMLDSHMKAMSHDQPRVTLTVLVGDRTETFELAANKEAGEGVFCSQEPKLIELLDTENVKGKLRTTIDGKPYSGLFTHSAHDDHDHSHESNEAHSHGEGN